MSRYSIVLKEEAEEDLIQASGYYEKQLQGLGDRFLASFYETVEIIAKNPNLYSTKYRQTKDAIIRNFPFVIVYQIEKHVVLIYAVFHTSRNPKRKNKRLKK